MMAIRRTTTPPATMASEAGRFLGLVDMAPRLRRRDRDPGAWDGGRRAVHANGRPLQASRWHHSAGLDRKACDHGAVPRSRIASLTALVAMAAMALPTAVAAHGPVPPEAPTLASLALGWSLQPAVAIPLLLLAAGWLALVRRIGRGHPDTPVPLVRTVAFLAGLAAIAVALMSGIERYDTTLFSVHMAQHLLLLLVAPPLIALAAPITQLLRAASPGVRNRVLLPI